MKQFVIGISVGVFVSVLSGTNLLIDLFHTSQSLAQATAD